MKKINIKDFLLLYGKIYNGMYEAQDKSVFEGLVEAGDRFMEANTSFMQELIIERKDLFSSDREVAALAATARIFF